jgi:hypothetical protein
MRHGRRHRDRMRMVGGDAQRALSHRLAVVWHGAFAMTHHCVNEFDSHCMRARPNKSQFASLRTAMKREFRA